jgi:hypothetical protein
VHKAGRSARSCPRPATLRPLQPTWCTDRLNPPPDVRRVQAVSGASTACRSGKWATEPLPSHRALRLRGHQPSPDTRSGSRPPLARPPTRPVLRGAGEPQHPRFASVCGPVSLGRGAARSEERVSTIPCRPIYPYRLAADWPAGRRADTGRCSSCGESVREALDQVVPSDVGARRRESSWRAKWRSLVGRPLTRVGGDMNWCNHGGCEDLAG